VPRPTAPAGFSKPTMKTRYYIDYEWWAESGKDINVHIRDICEEYGGLDLTVQDEETQVDWVDPVTAVVRRVDMATYQFLTLCSVHEEFITERTTLIEAVFRTLLAAGNQPMTPIELAQRTGRSADTILQTLSGRRVYKGLRPYDEDNLSNKE
jgi:hypothetical protein